MNLRTFFHIFLSCSFFLTSLVPLLGKHDTLYLCLPGSGIQLQADPGYAGYRWSPGGTLDNPTIHHPRAYPRETTTYYLEAITTLAADQNLISNPDFSAGNTAFSTDYGFAPGRIQTQGLYGVGDNPASFNSVYFSPCQDHTDGSGNMMIVDGSPRANQEVWCQSIEVRPGLNYAFSVWISSINAPNPAVLQFKINDQQIGLPFNASRAVCQWRQFYEIWNAGEATAAEICIINQNTQTGGNDFALDDFAFFQVGDVVRDTFTVIVEDRPVTEIDTAVCPGAFIEFNGQLIPADTTVTFSFPTDTGCDSLVRLRVDTLAGIRENGMPIVLTPSPGVTLDEPAPVEVGINDNASTPLFYQWTPSAGVACPTCPVTEVFPEQTTTYTIIATDSEGCTISAQWTATITFRGNFFIPNAFSPNGDGINDELPVFPGRGIDGIRAFRVFDRWGNLIFERKECTGMDAGCAWDGTFQGQNAPAGVYPYSLIVDYADGVSETIGGQVVLVR